MLESERDVGIGVQGNTERNRREAEYLDVDIDKWVEEGVTVYRSSHLITSILGVFFQ